MPRTRLGIEGDIGWADNKATNAGIPGTFAPGESGPGPLAATLALDASQVKADLGRQGIRAVESASSPASPKNFYGEAILGNLSEASPSRRQVAQ